MGAGTRQCASSRFWEAVQRLPYQCSTLTTRMLPSAMQAALDAAGIRPSNSRRYPVQDIKDAIERRYGVMPHVTCDGKGELSEVRRGLGGTNQDIWEVGGMLRTGAEDRC